MTSEFFKNSEVSILAPINYGDYGLFGVINLRLRTEARKLGQAFFSVPAASSAYSGSVFAASLS